MRIGVGLSIPELATRRSGGFSPLQLFTAGVQGAWYDPSDYSTLFQDSAGTTPVTAVEQPVRLMRDKSGNNNHATAPNDASRPVLRARYNNLTYSEQFDNGAWTPSGAAVSANSTVAPDGALTGDKLVEDTSTAVHQIAPTTPPSASGSTTYTTSFFAKAAERSFVGVWLRGTASGDRAQCQFNLSTGAISLAASALGAFTNASATVTSAGNGWYRCTLTGTAGAGETTVRPVIFVNQTSGAQPSTSYTGDGTSGIYIWGADLRTGSSAGTYQRIAAATDYATAGFLPYLYFVTDDSFSTNSIDFTATDKMSVCAGVTKLSDANIGMITEFSTVAGTSSGAFALRAPYTAGTADYGFQSTGTTSVNIPVTTYTSPITNVVTGLGNISAPSATLRVNGAQVGQITSSQGTGNYGNYPLFIGRRNNTSIPLNGNLYQLIVCGKTLSASELASTEAYVNSKTGAY